MEMEIVGPAAISRCNEDGEGNGGVDQVWRISHPGLLTLSLSVPTLCCQSPQSATGGGFSWSSQRSICFPNCCRNPSFPTTPVLARCQQTDTLFVTVLLMLAEGRDWSVNPPLLCPGQQGVVVSHCP